MADFLANAVVQITADSKQFLSQLNQVVAEAEKKTITLKVIPSTTGFVAELRRQLKEMVLPTVRVPVRPDPTGFKTALRAMVRDAEKDIAAIINVQPGKVTRGAAQTAAGGGVTTAGVVDKRVGQAELAVASAADAGVAARRKLSKEMTEAQKVATLLTRTDLQLKAAENAVAKAVISGIPALQAGGRGATSCCYRGA